MRQGSMVVGLVVVLMSLAVAGCARQQGEVAETMGRPPTEARVGAAQPAEEAPAGQAEAAALAEAEGEPEAALKGKKVVIVIAPRNFRDEEFELPYQELTKAGAHVTVASLTKGECVGAGGTKVQATEVVTSIKPEGYDALVLVGGPGMYALLDKPELVALAKSFGKAGKVVAAICVAPVILANAGLLKGKTATCWPDVLNRLREKGAETSTEPVVVSGKVITAKGPKAAAAFARAIVAALTPSEEEGAE